MTSKTDSAVADVLAALSPDQLAALAHGATEKQRAELAEQTRVERVRALAARDAELAEMQACNDIALSPDDYRLVVAQLINERIERLEKLADDVLTGDDDEVRKWATTLHEFDPIRTQALGAIDGAGPIRLAPFSQVAFCGVARSRDP